MDYIQNYHHCKWLYILALLLVMLCGAGFCIEVIVTVPETVAGARGETAVLPCSFVVNPHVVPLREYDLRWINETQRSSPANLYIYSSARWFDSAVNVPDETRYQRINQDLHIHGFSDGDTGHYCCEITLTENYTIWSHKKCVTVTSVDSQFLMGTLVRGMAHFGVFFIVMAIAIALICLLPGIVVFLAGILIIGLQVGREIHKSADIVRVDRKRGQDDNHDIYIEVSPTKKNPVTDDGLHLTETLYDAKSQVQEGPSYHSKVLINDGYDYHRGKRIENGHGHAQGEVVIQHYEPVGENEDLQFIQFEDEKVHSVEEEESDYEPFPVVGDKKDIESGYVDSHEQGNSANKNEVICVIELEDKQSLHSQDNQAHCTQSPVDDDIKHIQDERIEAIEVHSDAVGDEGIDLIEADDNKVIEAQEEDLADFPPPPPMHVYQKDHCEDYLSCIDEENQAIDIEEPDQNLLQSQEDLAICPPPPMDDVITQPQDEYHEKVAQPKNAEETSLLETENDATNFPPPLDDSINYQQDNRQETLEQSNDIGDEDVDASDPEDEIGHPGFAQALLHAYDKKQHDHEPADSVKQQDDDDVIEADTVRDEGAEDDVSNGARTPEDGKTLSQEPDLLIDHRPTQTLYETTID